MAALRLSINSRTLGNIEVEFDTEYGFMDAATEREQVVELLEAATTRVRRAYDIT